MQWMGWGALTLAIAGVVGPVGMFLYGNARYGNEIGWQEGAGFIALCACLFVLIVIETVALWLGRRSRATIPGLLAVGTGLFALVAAGSLIVYLIWDYVVSSGVFRRQS